MLRPVLLLLGFTLGATASADLARLPSPPVGAESAIVIDAVSGKVLWQRNADATRYPASTTKVMTALLLLEHTRPDDIIVAPADVEKVKESSMHLRPGERITARDMLHAILLRSANDGCYATAVHIAGSEAAFSELMNRRAREIGCTQTHFNNPNGLNDPAHYTSARDLALIAREAMKNPQFREAVQRQRYTITRTSGSRDILMVNHNKRLRKDPTCDGIKTGWTVPAGRCFVGSATRQGWQVITVVLKSKNWQEDTAALFDWSFKHYEMHADFPRSHSGYRIPVVGAVHPHVKAELADPLRVIVRKGTTPTVETNFPGGRKIGAPQGPVRRGQPVGEVEVTDAEGFSQRVPLLASENLAAAPTPILPMPSSTPNLWIVGLTTVAGTLWLRRSRRPRRPVVRIRG